MMWINYDFSHNSLCSEYLTISFVSLVSIYDVIHEFIESILIDYVKIMNERYFFCFVLSRRQKVLRTQRIDVTFFWKGSRNILSHLKYKVVGAEIFEC